MEPHNSGDSTLEIWDGEQGWIPFFEAFLMEATEYKLRCIGNRMDVQIQDVPLPLYQQQNAFFATMITPFQSGTLNVTINGLKLETFVYPDERKLTEEQFNLMLSEILEEANILFQLSGLETKVTASGRTRDINWTQWSYIDRSFQQLRKIFSNIEKQPFRRLDKQLTMMKREKVQHAEQVTLSWLDLRGYGEEIPSQVQNVRTFETRNVYENQVLKQQLQDLYRLLGKYETIEHEDIARKSVKYKALVQRWINSPFLKEITENKGAYTITQKFRKHPVYRLWYLWFDRLYKHDRQGIGFDYPISLKDTFQVYEMWCYLKIAKILRESGLVSDTRRLFRTTKDGIFLNLAENKESEIKLHGDLSLYYQRTYQYNSKPFHSYTQKMIPDIVVEGTSGIIVFDPKYRVPSNLGTALGEMHKYRDGIIDRETSERAVHQVYILTPSKTEQVDGMRFFQEEFHKKYRMGAVQAMPGVEDDDLRRKIVGCVGSLIGLVGSVEEQD